MKKEKQLSSSQLSEYIVEGMHEKKANQVILMDLRKVKNTITDYFVICSGNSDTQIDAIARSVEEVVYKKTNQNPWNTEGRQNKEWVLLDYVDVVVHIFISQKRAFYDIESLWGDAEITYFTDDLKPSKVPIAN
ncbi:ribosome silencing factor [Marinilongibacter aquaticus]|uniref:ribosome silencing factor n=1 Tax=Marinilongibacter aquaticus TaxID=2975157 RepID=UPI0021BD3986|nr:ribosome silencing factor [Marinilongibacter aquaticus]UBM60243.1 ribosome silencing factor [Marinilongibacter aquaticus]